MFLSAETVRRPFLVGGRVVLSACCTCSKGRDVGGGVGEESVIISSISALSFAYSFTLLNCCQSYPLPHLLLLFSLCVGDDTE